MHVQKTAYRLFAFVMAFVMVLGMLPVSAFAADTPTYSKVDELVSGEYVIVCKDYAMTSETHEGYTNNSDYSYSGLQGKEAVPDSEGKISGNFEVWTVTKTGEKITIQNKDGKYLTATYVKKENSQKNGWKGTLFLGDDEDTWSFEGKYLKNDRASVNDRKKTTYLVWDTDGTGNGTTDFFGIRTTGKEIFFYKQDVSEGHTHTLTKVDAKDPTCVKAGNIEYYTCDCGKYFEDANAETEITDKNSVTIAATSNHTGGTATCTKQAECDTCKQPYGDLAAHQYEDGKCKVCKQWNPDRSVDGTFTQVTELTEGNYVIVADGYALTSQEHTGYVNNNNYSYSGFYGKEVTVSDNEVTGVTGDMVWNITVSGDGYKIQHVDKDKYLASTYSSNAPKGGVLKLADEGEIWKLDSGKLVGQTSTKQLTYDNVIAERDSPITPENGNDHLITIRSTGDAISFYKYSEPAPVLQSIAVTTQPTKKAYEVGDTFEKAGMVVKATYDKGEDKDVTADCDFSPKSFTQAGEEIPVTLSYTEGNVTKTATVTVSVTAKQAALTGIAVSGDYKKEYVEGDDFDSTGMVVTATYSDNSTKAVSGYTLSDNAENLAVGTQTITVSYTEGEVTKTTTFQVTVTAKPAAKPQKVTELVDGQYVIASGLKAMSSEKHDGYTNENNYAYSGFQGKDITVSGNEITSDVANDLIWQVKKVSGGYTIQHLVSGKYLTATYLENSNGGYTGTLTLTDTAEDTWVLDSSFRLKSTKATNNTKGSTLYLTFDDKTDTITTGSGNLFGIRSDSNSFTNVDTIDFYALPTAVKGLDRIAVTTNPTKMTYEAGENFDKTGMVVTAYYSDNSNKPVEGYELSGDKNLSTGTATITITYTEDGFTRTTTLNVTVNGKPLTGNEPTKVTSIKDGQYVITSGKMAMTSDPHSGYTNNSDYAYSGFQGQAVTVESGKITAGATEDMTWEIRSISGGYSIKHVPSGKYLSASYTQNSGNNGYTGKLTLGDTIDTWVLDSNFHLKSTNASGSKGLYLTFDDKPDEIKSGSANLFGIRSDSNMDNVDVIDFYLIKEVTGGDNPGSGDATYIAFSSDVHNNSTSASDGSAGRLNNWITNVTNKIGATFKTMSFSGDSGDSKAKNEAYWERVQVVMNVVANNSGVSGNGNFTSGNHEWDSGNYGSLGSSNATAQKIKITGEAETASDYIIYAFGATSSDQSGTGYKDADITALDNYLSSAPTDRPIFIIAHFPLHSANGNGQNRSTKNADKVISTLNKHGDTHDIYFIWGHNHTLADNGETNYDKVITDKIGSTNIKFTYAAAGCMSDSEYSNGSQAVKGKGMVVKIENKQVKTMTYYDLNYNASYTYTNTVTNPEDCTHSNLTAVEAKAATCTEAGNNAYYVCSACKSAFKDSAAKTPTTVADETIAALGHDLKLVPAKASTCTEAGNNAYYQCDRCDAVFKDEDGETPSTVEDETLDMEEHTLKAVFDPETKTHTLSCDNCDYEEVEACSFSSEITTEATEEHNGVKTFTCSVCHGSYEEEFAYIPPELQESITRVSGKTRYETSVKIADTLKSELGVETFGTIVVANGENFPDALAGSYLATMKNAPILLTTPSRDSEICEYITANLSKNGTVYILGGTASVSKEFADQLNNAGIKTVRLSGKTRYETSLEILKEAKLNGKEILVCTGENFADALSVSALNKPILLVNGKKTELTSEQVQYLDSLGGGYKFYLIGGEAAINKDLEGVLEAYGTVERISGKAREDTAVAVARRFFPEATLVTLAYSRNYPDGLCGGSLAYQLGAPLLLVSTGAETAAAEYVESLGIEKGIVFGGTAGITNDSLKIIFPGETVG